MRRVFIVLAWWLAAIVGVAGQSLTLMWDPSPDPTVTGYIVSIDGTVKGVTSSTLWPFTATSTTHTACVASSDGLLVGPQACATWTAPPPPPPPPPPPETCAADGYGNGIDEDLDGLVDEGCLVRPPADTSAPVITLTIPRNGKSANYTVTATATDNVGVVSIRLYSNASGTPFRSCDAASGWTPGSPCSAQVKLGKGTYTFTAVAEDAAGNKGFASRSVTN